MDQETRTKIYLEKHKSSIITTAGLVILLPVMVVFAQVTTHLQQKAAEPQNLSSLPHSEASRDPEYSLLMKCFDKPNRVNPCTSVERKSADINGDGKIDGVDYNIYVKTRGQ